MSRTRAYDDVNQIMGNREKSSVLLSNRILLTQCKCCLHTEKKSRNIDNKQCGYIFKGERIHCTRMKSNSNSTCSIDCSAYTVSYTFNITSIVCIHRALKLLYNIHATQCIWLCAHGLCMCTWYTRTLLSNCTERIQNTPKRTKKKRKRNGEFSDLFSPFRRFHLIPKQIYYLFRHFQDGNQIKYTLKLELLRCVNASNAYQSCRSNEHFSLALVLSLLTRKSFKSIVTCGMIILTIRKCVKCSALAFETWKSEPRTHIQKMLRHSIFFIILVARCVIVHYCLFMIINMLFFLFISE